MATSMVDAPGTREGPCKSDCKHLECAVLRVKAESECRICQKPIGFGRRYYRDYQIGQDPRKLYLVHAACSDEEEKQGQQSHSEHSTGLASVFSSHARGE